MKKVLFFIGTLLAGAGSLHAGGFAQVNQSASAAGVANAFVATANDASASQFNPAGTAWQSGISIMAGIHSDFRDSSVIIPGGIAPNEGVEPNVGYLFGSWMPLENRIGVSFGFSPLFQESNNWNKAFGAASGLIKLIIDHAMMDIVYAVNSNLALSLGGDWYITRANLTQGANAFRGVGLTGFGGHASMLWKPVSAWSVGLMLRSGSNVTISGDASDELPMRLPDAITFGVAHDFADVWRLETDVKWMRWSALKGLNVVRAGAVTQSYPLNLRDTFNAMAGLTWTWRENAQLRLGYAFDQGANKVAGFNPVIADQDGHIFSLGAGGDAYDMHFDLAYSYTYFTDRIATGAFAGTYRDRKQSINLSVSKLFD
jgi:long-subunit fatty acid transport protein